MAHPLTAKSLSYCTHVDPRLIAVVQHALTLSSQDGGFTTEQSRTQAEEDALVAKGVSHSHHSHHIIGCPGAAPGYSGAVDLVPWNGVAFVWEWPRVYVLAAAMLQASIDLATPVTWGGVWDRLMSDISGKDAAAMQAESSAYAARERAAGNFHPLLDGPHYELGRN